jgi:cellulose synthase/poly-beta-1,6-N-acetylglucosamine synthase-like glycosyltransferase
MDIVFIICVLLTVAYVALMILYRMGWNRQKEFVVPTLFNPATRISVIIPARNETDNIGPCIESVLAQIYPEALFEIIVVDDHSEDNTAEIVQEYADRNVRCIRMAHYLPVKGRNSLKKAAIAAGIAHSNGTLIVTTDADCIAPNTWLRHMAALYEQEVPVMIVAPVIYKTKKKVVQLFQLIDFMSMQGITAAAHALKMGNMSNGANLAFTRAAFDTVGGYEGLEHLASGDDYLLMMKMAKLAPNGISYLRSSKAVMSTIAQPDWKSFLQQRIRWASKSGKYNDARLTIILLLVYLFNVMLLVLAIGSFFDHSLQFMAASILAIKIVVELYFLAPVAKFFNNERVLRYFPLLQPLHIVYIVLAGFLGFVGVYEWKGRRVK